MSMEMAAIYVMILSAAKNFKEGALPLARCGLDRLAKPPGPLKNDIFYLRRATRTRSLGIPTEILKTPDHKV